MSAITAKIMLKLWFGDFENGPKFTIDDIIAFFKKEEWKDIKIVIARLRKSEFIKQKQNYDGSVLVSLSEKGKLRALNLIFKRFDNRRERWDCKWRMVSFDIPNQYTKGRKAFVYRLKSGGFYEFQKSVFVYPYDCQREVTALVKLFKLEKYVRFILADFIDNEERLKFKFKLS